jgi:SAM-dependent methyltransferase
MTDYKCRICDGALREVLDLGRQPVSNAFAKIEDADRVPHFRLAIGRCTSCMMVQQLETLPPYEMYRDDYPYRASGSAVIRQHFEEVAEHILAKCDGGREGFVVEIGSNDGVMLKTLSAAGMRHLGVDPAAFADEVARSHGVNVRTAFFNESTAAEIHAEHGPANLIFSANTFSHIADLGTIFRGVDILLAPGGTFVFEDRSLADILRHNYFDQIYDEHIYLFSVGSVQSMAAHYGFELVDVEHLPLHGGSLRYTVARAHTVRPSGAVADFLAEERADQVTQDATFARFAEQLAKIKADLVSLLQDLRSQGRSVVGYGATSRSATVLNYCGIDAELLPTIYDSTPEKQGRVTPGSKIPVCSPAAFSASYPDYALLFAWNHAKEIMAKERQFHDGGGRWILYVPDVHIF